MKHVQISFIDVLYILGKSSVTFIWKERRGISLGISEANIK